MGKIEKGPQVFSREEFVDRLSRVRKEAESVGIEVLIVTDFSNINYLSGYSADSAYIPQALVLFPDEEEPVFYTRKQDAPAGIFQCFMKRSNIIGYPESYIGRCDKDGYDYIIDAVVEARCENLRIGIELSHLTANAANKFRQRLFQTKIIDASGIATRARLIKSAREIELMREAATLADIGMKRAGEVIRPGVRECEAAGEIMLALCQGTEEYGASQISPPYLCSTPRIGTSHIKWTDERFRKGSQVNVELGGFRHRYAAGLMRTFVIGTPQDKLLRLHEAEVEGMEAALEAARPGATCGEIAETFHRTIGRHGFEKESRCGYAIGVNWLETTASLQPGDSTVLEPNMTFHLMLGNWLEEDFGYVISETFRVTDQGGESFGKTPRQLFVIQ